MTINHRSKWSRCCELTEPSTDFLAWCSKGLVNRFHRSNPYPYRILSDMIFPTLKKTVWPNPQWSNYYQWYDSLPISWWKWYDRPPKNKQQNLTVSPAFFRSCDATFCCQDAAHVSPTETELARSLCNPSSTRLYSGTQRSTSTFQ